MGCIMMGGGFWRHDITSGQLYILVLATRCPQTSWREFKYAYPAATPPSRTEAGLVRTR